MITTIFNFFFHPDKIAWKGVQKARVAYVAMAILTFGHVAGKPDYDPRVNLQCPKTRPDLSRCYGQVPATDPTSRAFRGVFGGVLWPLYWSWEAQEKAQGPSE